MTLKWWFYLAMSLINVWELCEDFSNTPPRQHFWLSVTIKCFAAIWFGYVAVRDFRADRKKKQEGQASTSEQ